MVKSQSDRKGSKTVEIEQALIASKKCGKISNGLNLSEYTPAKTYEQKGDYRPFKPL